MPKGVDWLQETYVQPAKKASRTVAAFIEETKAAAKYQAGPHLTQELYDTIKLACQDSLKAFDTAGGDVFIAVAGITLPNLLGKVAEVAFGLPNGQAYRKAKSSVLQQLDDMAPGGAQDAVAKTLAGKLAAYVDELTKELQQKQDRDFQCQLLLTGAAGGKGTQQGGVLQPTGTHNRQGEGAKICYDSKEKNAMARAMTACLITPRGSHPPSTRGRVLAGIMGLGGRTRMCDGTCGMLLHGGIGWVDGAGPGLDGTQGTEWGDGHDR